jgi:hypothetical protein
VSWTNPRTWVLGEMVTETLLNTHLRDNMLFLKSNPQIASTTLGSQVLSGVNGTVTAIYMPTVVIPADVGAIYYEAWAAQLNTAAHQSSSDNHCQAVIYDTASGQQAIASVQVVGASPAVGAPLYLRSADLAYAGTTRAVQLYVTGVNCEGQLQAPMTLRVMRAY